MKKIYLLMMLFITSTVMGQTPIITMIMDGDCTGGTPKVLEIYAQGTVDFSNYTLEKQGNGNPWADGFDLTPLGTITDEFVYLYASHDTDNNFAAEFPTVTNSFEVSGSAMSFNGDDGVRIVETANSNVIDTYGVEGQDGSGFPWEYKDGYAKRNDNTGPDGAFVEANWTFSNGGVDGQCGTTTFAVIANAGSYTSASGPILTTSVAAVTGFLQFVGTPSTEQSFDVSGMNLTDDIVITVDAGDYEVSTTLGSGYGASVTIPFGTATVTPTPIYVRLDGSAVADPSNGELLITSTGATAATVTLEGEISAATPTVTVSKTEITGFSHFVGTASAADSFMVAGFNLTDDVIVTAPTNFEIALALDGNYTSTLTATNASGSASSTKIYVRLDGPSMNLAQAGDLTVTTVGASDKVIALSGETLEYTVSNIGDVTGIDSDGVGTSIGDYVTLTGVLHCSNFRGSGSGYDLTLIDDNNDGINFFSFDDIDGYTPTEGDELSVNGQIAQFNGLLQIEPATITVVSQGAALQTPTVVTELDESTESQFIEIENLTLVNGETEWPDNDNIDVTDGTTTFMVRVPYASSMVGTPTPNGVFSLMGIGKQFDNSSPFTSGYQIFPCSATPLCDIDVSTTLDFATITASESGLSYQWFDCDTETEIAGETGQSYTATENGNYSVIITDGDCVDTSDCVLINVLSLTHNEFTGVSVYPNPVTDVLNITNENGVLETVEVVSATGSVVYSSTVSSSNLTVNTAKLNAGVYFVNVRTANSVKTFKVVK